MPLAKRRGRPPKYVPDQNGRPVVGLSFSKSNLQYYATHSKPRKYFGHDFSDALIQFRNWEASRSQEPPVAIKISSPIERIQLPQELTPEYYLDQLNSGRSPAELKYLEGTYKLLPRRDVYESWRSEFLKDPAEFAQRIGIPQLSGTPGMIAPRRVSSTPISGETEVSSFDRS